MNLAEITDPTVLKALAYDQIKAMEIAQQNLAMLQARLEQLEKDGNATG